MAALTLLKLRTPEERHSPELRYTFERCLAEARRAFDGVELVILEAGETTTVPTPQTPWVLVMGTPCILVTATTLGALRQALEAGAEAARPHRLAATDLPQRFPLYTLRGFEQAEAALLKEGLEEGNGPGDHLMPIALLRGAAFAHLCAERGVRAVLEDPLLELDSGLGKVARVGLYHQFSDYYGEPRADVLPLIPAGTQSILEIGCGRGVTAQLLKERLGCSVVGVELNPQIAAEARPHLDEVLVGDVQELDIEGSFDLVLALELFEHLTDGEAFLERARGWLRPGGSILLSVPNVGHFSVVEDLLAGRWDYLPQGLLCYTHYRFFTRATLEDWLHRCGFSRYQIVPQKTPLPERLPWIAEGADFPIDWESLGTAGFYVRIEG